MYGLPVLCTLRCRWSFRIVTHGRLYWNLRFWTEFLVCLLLVFNAYFKSFEAFLSEVEKFPVEAGHYVFKTFFNGKFNWLGHRLVSVNKPLSYSCTRDYFNFSFTRLVPDISLFSTHSLRAGDASALANAGDPDRFFQRHRRWKSVSAKDGYVDDSLISRLSVLKSYVFNSVMFTFNFTFCLSFSLSGCVYLKTDWLVLNKLFTLNVSFECGQNM